MKAQVLRCFKARCKGQIVQHNPGEKLQVNVKVVQPLVNGGFVRLLESLDKAQKPIAAKIYSHILQDIVWLPLDPAFTGDGDGIPVYSIEEIRMMRGADEYNMRLLHAIKKIGSRLIAVKDTGATLVDANKIRRDSECY